MKIRITGRSMPKAQFGINGIPASQFGMPTSMSNGAVQYNGMQLNPNNPGDIGLLKQALDSKGQFNTNTFNTSMATPKSVMPNFTTPNYNRVNLLRSLAPKAPSLSFKPFATSGQAAASINPFSQSSNILPLAAQPAATTATAPEPARKWHSEWDQEGMDTDPGIVNAANNVGSVNLNTAPERRWHSEWDDQGFDTDPAGENYQPPQAAAAAQPKGPGKLAQAAGWYNKNIGQPVEKAFEGMDQLVSWGNLGTQLVNGYKKKKDFDKYMRRQTSTDSLFPEVTSEMSGNRGDYVVSGSRFGEFRPDEYVVNKGMYTGQFLPRMAQYGGGVIPDALTMPIEETQLSAALTNPVSTGEAYAPSGNKPAPVASSSGANPIAEQTWKEVSSQFQGVQNWGIWGDANHKKSVSDHNTGDALDIGILGVDQGTQIAQKLIKEAQDKNVKYIIWNKQIWNPSVSDSWRPYNGKNPHTDHVHVSFNRGSNGADNSDEVALSHNNPLNIHYGDFTSKYGATKGSKDGGGNVGRFPDLNTGIQAGKDLLFGPNYSGLTISQARNQWVSGNRNTPNASTSDIVKNMGGDKRLSDLSPAEKDKLFKEFARWEGKKAYTKIKDMNLFAEGGSISSKSYEPNGVYELTEDEIKNILASGGEVEFL